MIGLVRWAANRARMIFAFVVLSVGAGVLAYTGLPKEGAPNIDVPILYVSVPFPGVSAPDSERLLVRPLETELRGIEGLKEMTAYATENHAGVVLEFDFGWDKAATVAEVRDKVDQAQAEMPSDAEEPQVIEVNLSEFPILVVTLSGDAPERTLLRLAKDLQREVESLAPVLEAALAGHREEMLEVIIDPLKLEAYEVTAAELISIVDNNNMLIAAGQLDTGVGKFSVSVPGSFETAQDVYGLPIKVNGDRIVTLSEIATIRRTFEDADAVARFNGETTVALQVTKRVGENIIDTVAQVRATVAEQVAQWPPALQSAVKIDFSMDESQRVERMVKQLEGSVLTAVLLVMIVVVAALGLRSALLVGLAVPCSFLLAFALMGALGMTVSNMVMFGLILAVGMLVDGAIVVAEYADKRMTEGVEPQTAYRQAAERMFWPIVSSTATTLCAFLPMLLWPGMPGEFMSYLPITLIFVLTASLLVALIYLPVIGGALGVLFAAIGRLFTRMGLGRPGAGRSEAAAAAPAELTSPTAATELPTEPETRERTWVGRLIERVVGNPFGPFVAIGVALAALVGAFALFGAHDKGVEFFVKTEPERANLYVRARGNLSLEEQDRIVQQAENEVLKVEGVEAVFAFAGDGGLTQEGGEAPKDAIGQIQIELAPFEQRRPGDVVMAEIVERTSRIPGAIVQLSELKEGPEQGKPIQLEITSQNWDTLYAATKAARAKFDDTPGLAEVDDTRPLPGIEWELTVDRTAAGRFGADIAQIGALIQLVTRGAELGEYRPDDSDEELEIRVRFPDADRTLSTLSDMKVSTTTGLSPLSNFVTITPKQKIDEIARRDGTRFFVVRSDVQPGVNVNAKIAELQTWIDGQPAELAGVKARFVGDQEEQAESQAFLGQAFLGALGLMFVILLAQFNSVYNSALVLSAVVMSIAGVLIGMVVMDQSFSIIMTGTGIVALAGIVVNNNIVLIDTYQDYARTMNRIEAIIRTVEDRMRPVLLTTITTIAGLLPMVFATSIDFVGRQVVVGAPTALWWVPLSTAVVFGLAFATLLTLVVTPSALAARVWASRGARSLFGSDGETLADPVGEPPAPRKPSLEIAAE
ncbi:MAG: efflux RND transporter permease subunit [Pseudomonadota bacterium]